jgi:hypothetical protein
MQSSYSLLNHGGLLPKNAPINPGWMLNGHGKRFIELFDGNDRSNG